MSENKRLNLSLVGLNEDERKRVLEYAECVIGSVGFVNIVACGHEPVSGELKAVFRGRFFAEIGNSGFTKITLPLATLELNCYLAMKYGVIVKGETQRSKWCGKIKEIDCLGNFMIWRGRDKPAYEAGMKFKERDIKLDYDNLPKGVTLC